MSKLPSNVHPDPAVALRAAIREGHELLRDLQTERRAVKQMIAGIEGCVQRAIGERLEEAVKREIASLGEATEKAIRESVAKVSREFDKLAELYTGGNQPDRPSLEKLTRRYVEKRDRR